MDIPSHLINEHFDDRYFDVVDALDEANKIYFTYNSLYERILERLKSDNPFIIGETGFGTGRIIASLMKYLNESGLKNASIEYYTVELYPMIPERMCSILDEFKERLSLEIKALVQAYSQVDITVEGWHTMNIQMDFGSLTINLWIGEALDMVNALGKPCDVWFLDGHSPKKNPSIWRQELLMKIGEKTKAGGTCSTFTVAGSVRRTLEEAGFFVEKLAGRGGKKEVLHGVKAVYQI
jgi:tRNA U34 5-methylaminomethyl-2-thiouridine-forming methyltransferase MnmC